MNDPRVAASQMTATTGTVRLTAAQALVRYLAALRAETGLADVGTAPLFGGVFAIFGHGNVAGVGEALYRHRAELPTYRAHNEQAMAHAAIAYAKAHMRRRMMACTTSIGPGATNLVTAAALAHVNRLPVLFLPGDVFASRGPDPVLQQVEDFDDGGGVLYGLATGALRAFVETHAVPVAETQAGKGALPWDHPLQQGAIGVTGSPAANALAREADVVLAVGTRLSDFTTGSHSLFAQAKLVN